MVPVTKCKYCREKGICAAMKDFMFCMRGTNHAGPHVACTNHRHKILIWSTKTLKSSELIKLKRGRLKGTTKKQSRRVDKTKKQGRILDETTKRVRRPKSKQSNKYNTASSKRVHSALTISKLRPSDKIMAESECEEQW